MRPLATVVPGRRPSHDADVFVLEARIAQRVHALQAMPLLEHERVSRAVYGLVTCTTSSPCGTPIMTSHLCAASVLRTKPVACGYQLYESPLPSLSASNSASLFSKPPPRSVENGMLFGSAQTLSTLGSTSSIDQSERSTACASSFPHRNVPAIAAAETYKLNRSHLPLAELVIVPFSSNFGASARGPPLGARQRSALMSEAAVFRLGSALRFVFVLLRSPTRDGFIGACPQIDEYVIEIAHDVRIGAERWHDALLRRVDVLAPVDDNIGEVCIVHRLQGIAKRGRITRSFAVGTMTDMAIRVIAAES